jgi:hypothetical protein
MKLLNRIEEQHVANSVIADPEQSTTMDDTGAVTSVQAANITMPERELDAIWTPMHLERLARTYWKYLSRVTLGLIRVEYSDTERAVVLIARPFVLLRFQPPDYEMSGGHGTVRWRIIDGVLVARRDHGHLEIEVDRCPADRPDFVRVHVEVEVANFYPAIATWVARWFYVQTQSRIHVLVTHGFLRSLARLELEQSAVGRFAADGDGGRAGGLAGGWAGPYPHAGDPPVNVGDTPWRVWAGIAAGVSIGASAVYLRWGRRRR